MLLSTLLVSVVVLVLGLEVVAAILFVMVVVV